MLWKNVQFKMFGREIAAVSAQFTVSKDEQQTPLSTLPEGVAFSDAARVRLEDIQIVKQDNSPVYHDTYHMEWEDETGRVFKSPIFNSPEFSIHQKHLFIRDIETFLINEP